MTAEAPSQVPPQAPTHSRVGAWVGLGVIAACVAVGVYLSVNRPVEQTLASEENRKQVELGEKTYQRVCISCHGMKLSGKPTWAPGVTSKKQAGIPLNADGLTWHLSDNHLYATIATGLRVEGKDKRQVHDAGFAGVLSEREIWALIAYFKTTWTARQLASQKETTLRERPAKDGK